MPAKPIKTLDLRTREKWRSWLMKHHDTKSEIWLIFHKRHTSITCIPYNDSVEEALCVGWIDSTVRRLDDARYARKFTPRRPGSNWSTINRGRYAALKSRGLLTAPGLNRAPTSTSGDAPTPCLSALPPYIEQTLKTVPRAWQFFKQLAPSYQRAYIGWIDSAKREQTKQKRLREALTLLAAGKKLGLK